MREGKRGKKKESKGVNHGEPSDGGEKSKGRHRDEVFKAVRRVVRA